jgi:hypothetical protein
MCPVCIATAAWVAAGTTSTGGLGALLLVRNRRPRAGPVGEYGPQSTPARPVPDACKARPGTTSGD